ncbi:MAG: hypothetical protein IPK83_20865 [Planctomycetes bacterium]|nr:hypothetical protein [Planctomycetota bacterium]
MRRLIFIAFIGLAATANDAVTTTTAEQSAAGNRIGELGDFEGILKLYSAREAAKGAYDQVYEAYKFAGKPPHLADIVDAIHERFRRADRRIQEFERQFEPPKDAVVRLLSAGMFFPIELNEDSKTYAVSVTAQIKLKAVDSDGIDIEVKSDDRKIKLCGLESGDVVSLSRFGLCIRVDGVNDDDESARISIRVTNP